MITFSNSKKTFLLTALGCLLNTAVEASVVTFDNITNNTISINGYWSGYFSQWNATSTLGEQFTANSTGFIDSIELAASHLQNFSVGIYSDNSGAIGSLLENISLTGYTTANTFASGTYASGVNLISGNTYWVIMGQTPGIYGQSFGETWDLMTGSGNSNRIYLDTTFGITTVDITSGAYSSAIPGLGMTITLAPSPVPLPAAFWFFGSALTGIAGFNRRKFGLIQTRVTTR